MKLWNTMQPPYEIGVNYLTNKEVTRDIEGWVDAKVFRPRKYDLVHIKTEEQHKKGWWDGQRWDGLKIRDTEEVLYWKQANIDEAV